VQEILFVIYPILLLIPIPISIWYIWLYFKKKKRGEQLSLYPFFLLLAPFSIEVLYVISSFFFVSNGGGMFRSYEIINYYFLFGIILLFCIFFVGLFFIVRNLKKHRFIPVVVLLISVINAFFIIYFIFPFGKIPELAKNWIGEMFENQSTTILKESFSGIDAKYFNDPPRPKVSYTCKNSLAQKYISGGNLFPLVGCRIEEFTIEGQKIYLIQITYGKGEDCPSGCIYQGRTILVKEGGEEISGFTPDALRASNLLPVDMYGLSCNYVWADDWPRILDKDPKHIIRTIVPTQNGYKWLFKFNGFNGGGPNTLWSSPSTYAKHMCIIKSGFVVTDINGKNPVTKDIAVKYKMSSCAGTMWSNIDGCCAEYRTIKSHHPEVQNPSPAICAETPLEQCEKSAVRKVEEERDLFKDSSFKESTTTKSLSCRAGVQNDPSLCWKISQINARDDCFEMLARNREDPEMCLKIAGWKRYSCVEDIAVRKKDVQMCKHIPISATQYATQQRCMYSIIMDRGDISLCGEIINANPDERYYTSDNCNRVLGVKMSAHP